MVHVVMIVIKKHNGQAVKKTVYFTGLEGALIVAVSLI